MTDPLTSTTGQSITAIRSLSISAKKVGTSHLTPSISPKFYIPSLPFHSKRDKRENSQQIPKPHILPLLPKLPPIAFPLRTRHESRPLRINRPPNNITPTSPKKQYIQPRSYHLRPQDAKYLRQPINMRMHAPKLQPANRRRKHALRNNTRDDNLRQITHLCRHQPGDLFPQDPKQLPIARHGRRNGTVELEMPAVEHLRQALGRSPEKIVLVLRSAEAAPEPGEAFPLAGGPEQEGVGEEGDVFC